MARQYFCEVGQERRHKFISRDHSYHGTTMGALALSGHLARRGINEPILARNVCFVSECNAYRQRHLGESDASFVSRKASELEQKFLDEDPSTVIAFVCEPISGAALGCVPYVPGYLAAMKAVCRKYGALFILDEIMCGMGRSGTLHAWQAEYNDANSDCLPDLQMIGKGLGGGYQPIAGVIAGHEVVNALAKGTGSFKHGQTYQAHPASCAAALAVQTIIVEEDLLSNVRAQGALLSSRLHTMLDAHPHVGDIRGIGLFWGIEFVRDKKTKAPFEPKTRVAERIVSTALTARWCLGLYPGQGTVDGVKGDHVIIAPAYNITAEDVEIIVGRVVGVIGEVFDTISAEEAIVDSKL